MATKFDNEQIDKLLANCKNKADIFGEDGLIKQFVKSILERALEGELTEHLGYKKHDPNGNEYLTARPD